MPAFFNDTKWSDVTIRLVYNTDGSYKDFQAHRVILAAQSEWFNKAFSGPWKETEDRIIELQGDNPAAFEIVLKYIYGLDPATAGENADEGLTDELLAVSTWLKVSQVVDKYMVNKLEPKIAEGLKKAFAPPAHEVRITQAINEYYQHAQQSNTIGKAIAEAIVQRFQLHKSTAIEDLIKIFPIFATDLILAEREARREDDAASPCKHLWCDACKMNDDIRNFAVNVRHRCGKQHAYDRKDGSINAEKFWYKCCRKRDGKWVERERRIRTSPSTPSRPHSRAGSDYGYHDRSGYWSDPSSPSNRRGSSYLGSGSESGSATGHRSPGSSSYS